MLKLLALPNRVKLQSTVFEKILSFVDAEKRQRIGKFYRWQDAQRSLLGDFLIRATLSDMLKVKKEDLSLKKSELGKPYLDTSPEVFFNISHSGDWIVGAFDSMPVGIDIEKLKKLDLDMARKILDVKEFAQLIKQNEADGQNYFYKTWTYNESYTKMCGKGMSLPLFSREVLANKAFFKMYFMDPAYVLSVCSISNEFPESISFTDLEILLQEESNN